MRKNFLVQTLLLVSLLFLLTSNVDAQDGLKVDANGNVGIGTSYPDAKVTIYKNTSTITTEADYAIKINDGSSDTGLYLGVQNSGGIGIIQTADPGTTWGGKNLILQPNGGNVGIGTVSPNNKLEIGSGGAGYNGNEFVINDGGTKSFAIDQTSSITTFYTNSNYAFLSGGGGTGNFGIGTTNPNAVLTVQKATTGNIAQIWGTGTNAGRIYISNPIVAISQKGNGINDGARLNGPLLRVGIDENSSTNFNINRIIFEVNSSGNVGVGIAAPGYKLDVAGAIRCTSLTQTSDVRLKEDIAPIDNALDRIAHLRGVSFRWNDETPTEKNKQIGVIGQEVEKVFPEAVSTDAEGYKSVAYAKLVAPMIEAIKELKMENERLRARIEALEGK